MFVIPSKYELGEHWHVKFDAQKKPLTSPHCDEFVHGEFIVFLFTCF